MFLQHQLIRPPTIFSVCVFLRIAGCVSVTLVGAAARRCDSSAGSAVGGSGGAAVRWVSDSAVRVKTAAAVSVQQAIVATSDMQRLRTLSQAASVDRPGAVSVAGPNVSGSGAVSVTVTGVGLGAQDASGWASVAASGAEAAAWVSMTSATVKVGSGVRRGLCVMATTSSQRGWTLSQAVSYSGAVGSGAVRRNGAATGGTSVTVVGSELARSDVSARARATATGSGAESTRYVSATGLALKSSRGGPLGVAVMATVGAQIGSASSAVTTDVGAVSGGTRVNRVGSGSTSVTVVGVCGLGGSGSSASAGARAGAGSGSEATVWVSGTAVQSRAAAGAGRGSGFGGVAVTAASRRATASAMHSVDAASTSEVSQGEGGVGEKIREDGVLGLRREKGEHRQIGSRSRARLDTHTHTHRLCV